MNIYIRGKEEEKEEEEDEEEDEGKEEVEEEICQQHFIYINEEMKKTFIKASTI